MNETGATKAQMEAAVAHWYASFGGKVSRVQTESEGDWRDDLVHYASHLVPPGARIFEEEDVAAVRRVMNAVYWQKKVAPNAEAEDAYGCAADDAFEAVTPADLDRLFEKFGES